MNDGNVYLRQTLGWMGMALPVLSLFFGLVFGSGFNPEGSFASISATHYSNAYVLFEGLVFATSMFLITYRGYDIKDFWLSTLAGVGGILLVLFPTSLDGAVNRNFLMVPMNITTVFHGIGAAMFFGFLAWIEVFQFTKSGTALSGRKLVRNRLYRICGITMFASVILSLVLSNFAGNIWGHWVLLGEAIGLWAFGIAWLVKGEFLLKDL